MRQLTVSAHEFWVGTYRDRPILLSYLVEQILMWLQVLVHQAILKQLWTG